VWAFFCFLNYYKV